MDAIRRRDNLREALERQPSVDAVELEARNGRVLFGVRSADLTAVADEPLHGAIWDVFTVANGLIVRIDEFKTRAEAAAALDAT